MDINHPFPLDIDYDGNYYEGWVTPSEEKGADGLPISFRVMLNGDFFAYLCCGVQGWVARDGEERPKDEKHPKDLVDVIGKLIRDFYQRAVDEEELERHDGSAGAFSATEMGRDDED